MHIIKVILGLICFVAALLFGLFALACRGWESILLACIPAAFAMCLVIVGRLLIVNRRSPLSSRAKFLIILVVAAVIVSPIVLDIHIRHERAALQARSKEFLLRPIPKLLIPDSNGYVGDYYIDTNSGPQNGVFGYSQILIKRYADTGRIRWSARIQGQFAVTGEGVNGNIRSDAINTNEEVLAYMAERNAILAEEWRMGFWQWVEDTIEMKTSIPEIEEEDAPLKSTSPAAPPK